jgi:hypothetical protein
MNDWQEDDLRAINFDDFFEVYNSALDLANSIQETQIIYFHRGKDNRAHVWKTSAYAALPENTDYFVVIKPTELPKNLPQETDQ